ncbi:MAG: rRNA maturation RNase YbeY [Clostridia bacterium]|nr:rRNA maturation RNase YbeY [Clostridia bacterium]
MQELVEINWDSIQQNKEYEDKIVQVLNKCFEEENLKDLNLYISVTLTSPTIIRKLNNEYRNIDKETDVLSFPMFEKSEIDEIVKNKQKQLAKETIGDIIISVQRVKQQAVEYEHSFERELSYMLVHGFYHLMGYDHIQEQDKNKMRPKEEKILNELKIWRN